MKEFARRTKELSVLVAGAIRRALDPPLGDDARSLDVRRAIVEAVEQQVEPAGAGRRVLPGDLIEVKVLYGVGTGRAALQAVLADIQDVIVRRLRELQCDVPRGLRVDVAYLRKAPTGWAIDQRLSVALQSERDEVAAAEPPVLTIIVTKGTAEKQKYTFADALIRIGRTAAPTDDRGRPRFNDVVFLDDNSPENGTVGRGHAFIRFTPANDEYRVFDEGSSNGTRIIRNGEIVEVPRRDPLGAVLVSGDEVQFGRASVRVQIRPSESSI